MTTEQELRTLIGRAIAYPSYGKTKADSVLNAIAGAGLVIGRPVDLTHDEIETVRRAAKAIVRTPVYRTQLDGVLKALPVVGYVVVRAVGDA